jgi:hypothetical protein
MSHSKHSDNEECKVFNSIFSMLIKKRRNFTPKVPKSTPSSKMRKKKKELIQPKFFALNLPIPSTIQLQRTKKFHPPA